MILETKLSFPQPKAGALLRTALIERIKNNLDKKLILITADAGYGKTTLLGQLVKTARLPAVFYHMDQGDSDLVTFYSYLIAGLEKLAPGVAVRSAGLLKQGSQISGNYELLMGTLINELLEKRKEELFLVLDDYQHLAENSPVHQALDFFIDHMPDIVHVIIASRSLAESPSLAKWIAKQDAFPLTKEHLAFTEAEVSELLFKTYSQSIENQDLKNVLQCTEGWITGIQLILAQIRSQGQGAPIKEVLHDYRQASLDRNVVFHYFANEIYSHEPEKDKTFLRQSSVLAIINPEACASIFDIADAEKHLERLEKRNLFIFRAGPDEYRYHRLFQEFLQKQINGGERIKLHAKAAEYYNKKGREEQAIDHYLMAGDYERAGKVILQVSDKILWHARFTVMSDWLQQLPDDIYKKHPMLLVIKGIMLRFQGRLEEAEQVYVLAQQAVLNKKADGKYNNPDLGTLSSALCSQGKILWMKGLYRQALPIVCLALKKCPGSEPGLLGDITNLLGMTWKALGDSRKARANYLKAKGYYGQINQQYELITAEANLAGLHIALGEIAAAVNLFRQLLIRLQANYFYGTGVIFANAAKSALLFGDMKWAKQCLTEGMALCTLYEDAQSLAALHNIRGLLSAYERQYDPALQHLDLARDLCEKIQWGNLQANILMNFCLLYRLCGKHEKVAECVARAQNMLGENINEIKISLEIEKAYLEINDHQFDRADEIIANSAGLAKRHGWKIQQFQALLAGSLSALKRGQEKQSARLASRAVKMSKTYGYAGILCNELRHNLNLAELAFQSHAEKAYMSRLKDSVFKPVSVAGGAAIDLEVTMFGALQLRLPGGKAIPVKWWFRKEASLFAYLLIHRNRVCSREELMSALWPTADKRQAEQNLYPAVSMLKKALTAGCKKAGELHLAKIPIVAHQEKGYRISPDIVCRLDVETLLSHWRNAQKAEGEENTEASVKYCQSCLDLYQDGFLSNLGERWCEEMRHECESIYLQALRKVARHKSDNREYAEAVSLYQQYIDHEYDFEEMTEEIHWEYWRALKALGRIADIQKDYAKLRMVLRRDFNAVLKNETKELFARIIATQ